MKRLLLTALAVVVAAPLVAQQPAAAPQNEGDKIVASVNGEVITKARLDQLYHRLGAQMRAQYEKTGGKAAFLENYVKKRLLVQEALKAGFDKRSNVQIEMDAARESALFDLYVRDVVAEQFVTDAAIRKYYDENRGDFQTPERVKVRHIVIAPQETGPAPKTKEEARRQITAVFAALHAERPAPGTEDAVAVQAFMNKFAQAARKYSEDASAENGGDLGWVEREMLDARFAEAAFNVRKGMMSGVVESGFGYHLIFIEDKQPAGFESFEEARPTIREFLMNQNAANVMGAVARLTNELRQSSKVALYPENIR